MADEFLDPKFNLIGFTFKHKVNDMYEKAK